MSVSWKKYARVAFICVLGVAGIIWLIFAVSPEAEPSTAIKATVKLGRVYEALLRYAAKHGEMLPERLSDVCVDEPDLCRGGLSLVVPGHGEQSLVYQASKRRIDELRGEAALVETPTFMKRGGRVKMVLLADGTIVETNHESGVVRVIRKGRTQKRGAGDDH
jgi:hypothetical protein